MDERLRQLARQFRASGSLDAEVEFLRGLLRVNQITQRQLNLASYLGYPATQGIAPYTTPYDIAKLMHRDAPKPPKSSWFCEPMHAAIENDDANDIAHLWADNLSFEYGTDVVMVAIGLCLKFIAQIKDYATYLFDDTRRHLQVRQLVSMITRLQGAIIASVDEDYQSMHHNLMRVSIPTIDPELHNIVTGIIITCELTETEDHRGSDWMHHAKETFKDCIEYCIRRNSADELCDFLSQQLPTYILGYVPADTLLA